MATTAPSSILIKAKAPALLSRARERRSRNVYFCVAILGLVPSVIGLPADWQAAGLGLMFPGAGFLTMGLVGIVLTAFTLALFVLAMIAWFGAGMVIAPAIVWIGSAALAFGLAPGVAWGPAPYIVVAATIAGLIYNRTKAAKKEAANVAARNTRNAFLPTAIATLRQQQLPIKPTSERELDLSQLQLLRYALDRALQPVENFDGFDNIDQFQTSAIRYQINALAYALALSQCHYTPNFHGYLSQAQRQLIEKYLLRRVWSYWIYESAWGHLNFTNFDPAGKDNVMLTGFFGLQVGLYMSNTGDTRYLAAGSLPFKLNARTTYQHSYSSIIASISRNFQDSEFCLYPCEPNWIYPICNHYGMTALTLHDRLTGKTDVKRIFPKWLAMLDTELSDAKGSPIALKSSLTGWMPPFPAADGTYVPFANCFMPERAERLWALARTEMMPLVSAGAGGHDHLALPGAGIDFGNYKKGHAMNYAFIKMAAREMGDTYFADLAGKALDEVGGYEVDGSVARYAKASTIGNAYAIISAMQQRNDFRNAVVEGPDACALAGPILADANYPDILVARAYSHGEDLELVLHPGSNVSNQCISIARLHAGRTYSITGVEGLSILTANADGCCSISINILGRTLIRITPVL